MVQHEIYQGNTLQQNKGKKHMIISIHTERHFKYRANKFRTVAGYKRNA